MILHKQDGFFQKAEWWPVIRHRKYNFSVGKDTFVNSVILPKFCNSLAQCEMFSNDVTEE